MASLRLFKAKENLLVIQKMKYTDGYNNINNQLDATITNVIDNYNQLNMFRAIISPILKSTDDAACWQHCRCIIPQAVNKHSLVLLRMGEIVARNMFSWLKLSITFVIVASSWLFILLYPSVYFIFWITSKFAFALKSLNEAIFFVDPLWYKAHFARGLHRSQFTRTQIGDQRTTNRWHNGTII